jgi:hypothetical protein
VGDAAGEEGGEQLVFARSGASAGRDELFDLVEERFEVTALRQRRLSLIFNLLLPGAGCW